MLDATFRGPDDASRLVVFLHGYGADGADLIGLADALMPHMPDTAFAAPDAPERCALNPAGRQWFGIPDFDGTPEEARAESMRRSMADLDAFLDHTLAERDLAEQQVALFGFSQGTMMSLLVGPRRDEPLAAIVGFSGRLLLLDEIADTPSRPPVLLVHGDLDDVVSPHHLPEAAEALGAAGFEVFAHVMRGTAHAIAPDGLGVALAQEGERLALEPARAPSRLVGRRAATARGDGAERRRL